MSNADLNHVIVIAGPTGSGKTKLSIDIAEIAQKAGYCPHIISYDSMQIYKDINILNAKVSEDEMKGIPHHLIGHVSLYQDDYSLHQYRLDANAVLNEIFSSSTENTPLPIFVGGTNLYIESILCPDKFQLQHRNPDQHQSRYSHLNDNELYTLLVELDPEKAKTLHKNDRKRILRAIERVESFKSSDDIDPESECTKREEMETHNMDSSVQKFKFGVLYLDPERKVLNSRLENRIDVMVKEGLKEEIKAIVRTWCDSGRHLDYGKGAFQSIGFKEFKEWIQIFATTGKDDVAVFDKCLTSLKTSTKQYARKQMTWIKNRFLQGFPMKKLDSTDPSQWNEKVLMPAWNFTMELLSNQEPQMEQDEGMQSMNENINKICKICNRTIHGHNQWEAHLKSRQHRNKKKRKIRNKVDIEELE